MQDYWVEIKYKISGLKLLAEVAAKSSEAKERVISEWFSDDKQNDDQLCRMIFECAKTGIINDRTIKGILDDMIQLIPMEERNIPDTRGFMFVPNESGEIVERVYCEKECKYRLRFVYPGLIPGSDAYGDSFADLAYNQIAQGVVRDLEEQVSKGSMIEWGKIVNETSDDELTVLATALSRSGRHLLFAGLEDERLPRIVEKAVLLGRVPDDNAQIVAENILKKFRDRVLRRTFKNNLKQANISLDDFMDKI